MDHSEVRLEELFNKIVSERNAVVFSPERKTNYREFKEGYVHMRYVAPEVVHKSYAYKRDKEALMLNVEGATVHVRQTPYAKKEYELNIMIDSSKIDDTLSKIKESFHSFEPVAERFKNKQNASEPTTYAERFGIENIKDISQLFYGLLENIRAEDKPL